MKMFSGLIVLVCASCMVLAVEPDSRPETENVGHTRHHHPHNPKHETSDDRTRFFTDRQSTVEIPLPSEEDAFSFVVFGDRTGGPDDGVAILADAVRDTNLLEPDLVMTVGDLIQGYTESPAWMTQMAEFRAVMDKLICPWFPVAGNHDVYWRYKGTEQKPENEMEELYEMHFGPLWYSFSHKNNYFIVLHTDEGNPETGERTFHKPESQRMSPEQRAFLTEALARGKDADHVFVFLHHPRWLKGEYGDDWDNVHQLLVEAGNVAAVFAGHIHYMRHDGKRDGIEYVSLATVGGHQSGTVPEAGYLNQYHVVTVRKDQIAMAAYPVGEVMDPRDITGELATQSALLAKTHPKFHQPLQFDSDGSVSGYIETDVVNPTSFAIDYTITARSDDSRWYFPNDHYHGSLAPGESRSVGFRVLREPGDVDGAFRLPELVLDRDLLTKTFRYEIPTVELFVPVDPSALPAPSQPMHESVLELEHLRSTDSLSVPDELIQLGQGAFTIEAWLFAERFDSRTGLLCKTEGSDYGIFVNDGRPSFSVHLDGAYVAARAPEVVLEVGRWHHVAGVYDGQSVSLYVDGQLVANKSGSGKRDTNALPLIIGADVNRNGFPSDPFYGMIDEVRLSDIARYEGDHFTPRRWNPTDERTVLLYHMDGTIGPWMYDASGNHAHAWITGEPALRESR